MGLIMVVAPLRRYDDQSKEEVERPPESPPILQSFEQNITADSPGSTAQGAFFGDVINHGQQPSNGPTAPAATESPDKQP
jgi:hypothetical protein